eukprot:gene46434-17123_t
MSSVVHRLGFQVGDRVRFRDEPVMRIPGTDSGLYVQPAGETAEADAAELPPRARAAQLAAAARELDGS